MTVVVVGAGIAGLACARELVDAGMPARVIERDSVVGGRLAGARIDGRYADIGAAYLTADDPGFRGLLDSWRIGGLVRPWTDTMLVYDGTGPPARTTGPMRWAAPGGLHGLAVDLARELDVTLDQEVTSVPKAEAVVLAMPGPQALRIVDSAAARAQLWSPALAAVLTYPERSWPDFRAAFVNADPVLERVFDDGDRRGDRAPVLVAHSTAAFARHHLEDPDAAADEMEKSVRELLGLPRAAKAFVHGWSYAQPAPGTGLLAEENNVYLAGDAFGRPRVQTAWLSGRAVARAILRKRRRQSTER